MGKGILQCFEEADRLGGLVARMRLASLAQITSTEAATMADTPEALARTQKVVAELRNEFAKAPEPQKGAAPPGAIVAPGRGEEQTRVLRRHLSTYLDLMAQRSLLLGDVAQTVRRVNEAASVALAVQRVSVWFTDATYTRISCADLFDQHNASHTSGNELFAKDFAPYFRALRTERTVAAHDANNDPRTSCFSEVYLKPLRITSLLDVPIWVDKRMVGVICHEHVGPKRTWDADEETFAYLMSSFVALALERKR